MINCVQFLRRLTEPIRARQLRPQWAIRRIAFLSLKSSLTIRTWVTRLEGGTQMLERDWPLPSGTNQSRRKASSSLAARKSTPSVMNRIVSKRKIGTSTSASIFLPQSHKEAYIWDAPARTSLATFELNQSERPTSVLKLRLPRRNVLHHHIRWSPIRWSYRLENFIFKCIFPLFSLPSRPISCQVFRHSIPLDSTQLWLGQSKKKSVHLFFLVFFFFSSSSFSFFRLQRVTSGAPIYIGDRLKTLYAIASAGPDPYFMELGLGICRSINGRRLSPAAEKKIANKKKKNEQQKESHRSTSWWNWPKRKTR